MDKLDIAYKALAVVGAIFMFTGMIRLLTCADGNKLRFNLKMARSGCFLIMIYAIYAGILKNTILNANFVTNKLSVLGITASTINACKPLIYIILDVWAILAIIYLFYDKKN